MGASERCFRAQSYHRGYHGSILSLRVGYACAVHFGRAGRREGELSDHDNGTTEGLARQIDAHTERYSPSPVASLTEDTAARLLADYRDRYKDEWARRDRIMRELQLLLVIAGVEIPAHCAFLKHAGALLREPLTWGSGTFFGLLVIALVLYGIGATVALRVLWCANAYRFLVKPEKELGYFAELRDSLGEGETAAQGAAIEFTRWRAQVYAEDTTKNATINGELNERLHRAKRWIVLSIPAVCAAGLFYFLG